MPLSRIAARFAELHAEHIAALDREGEKSAAIEAGRIADLDELEQSARRALVVDDASGPTCKAQALRIAGSRRGTSHGASGRRRERRRKKLGPPCFQCGKQSTIDVRICSCGAEIPEDDTVERKNRKLLVWADHADLLGRSPEIDVRDIINTLFEQPLWRRGEVARWAAAFREWQRGDRERHANERGRGWRFGFVRAVTKRVYLRRSMVARLAAGGVDMARGRNPQRTVDLTDATCMALELFIDSAMILGFERVRERGVSRDDFVTIRDALRSGRGVID
jgi:hypothetical protein